MKTPLFAQTRHWLGVAVLAGTALLSGCGNDTGPAVAAAQTLNGVAAIGAPIVGGTVNITCAGGNALSTTTDAGGLWTVTLSGQTLPCAVKVSGGSLPGGTAYHAFAVNIGTVNITPLTDLMVASATGQDPATWFAGVNQTTLQAITTQTVTNALTALRTALNLPALNNVNPLTDTFSPVAGNAIDDILEALQTALTNAGIAYSSLLNNLYANTTVSANLQNAFLTAWQASLSAANTGGSNTGGSNTGGGSCGSGGVLLTFSANNSAPNLPFTDGTQVCITAVAGSSLSLTGVALTNPTVNMMVLAPYSADVYFNLATGETWEVVFNNGVIYEVNVSRIDLVNPLNTVFVGQFS